MNLCYPVDQRIGFVNGGYKCCVRKEGTNHEFAVWYSGWVLDFEGCGVELVQAERNG